MFQHSRRISILIGTLAFVVLGAIAFRVRGYLQDTNKTATYLQDTNRTATYLQTEITPVLSADTSMYHSSQNQPAHAAKPSYDYGYQSNGISFPSNIPLESRVPGAPNTPPILHASSPTVPGYHPPIYSNSYTQLQLEDAQVSQLVQQIQSAPSNVNTSNARGQLADLLGVHLAKQFDKQEKEIEKLEKRLAEAKAKLEQRKNRKTEIVERRIQQLLGEKDELDWEVDSVNAIRNPRLSGTTPMGLPNLPGLTPPNMMSPLSNEDPTPSGTTTLGRYEETAPNALPEFGVGSADTLSPELPIEPLQQQNQTFERSTTSAIPTEFDSSVSGWMQSTLRKAIDLEASLDTLRSETDAEKRLNVLKDELSKALRIVELESEQLKKMNGQAVRSAERSLRVAEVKLVASTARLAQGRDLFDKKAINAQEMTIITSEHEEATINMERSRVVLTELEEAMENFLQFTAAVRRKYDELANPPLIPETVQ